MNKIKSFFSSYMKIAFFFLTLLLVSSCGSNENPGDFLNEIQMDEKQSVSGPVNDFDEPVTDRKIIKNGDLRFETASVEETTVLIRTAVAELGGYIGNENIYDYKDRIEYTVVVRVPENNFDQLVDKISSSAEKLESKNINSLDVTEEFIDVEARVKTKKELEARYKEILKQASRVDEILNIEREIGKLRSEIESLEGRLNYLKNRVALSSLTVTYYEKTSSPFGFFSKFYQALKNGWTYLLWFIIILTSLWPFILLTLVILFIVLRVKQNRLRKKNIQK
ncbi:MAG: DUF4349 domain-containing protein [Ignavibacteriaceae bacterium]